MLLLPVPVAGAYAPIGRQHSLAKPKGASEMAGTLDAIRTSLQRAVSAGSCAGGKEVQAGAAGMPPGGAASQPSLVARDASYLDALQWQLRTIFWMHRLPVYRARVREIFEGSIDSSRQMGPDMIGRGKEPARLACLAEDVASVVQVESARLLCAASSKVDGDADMRQAVNRRLRHRQQGLLAILMNFFTLVSLKHVQLHL
jgi:hypothetical protein